MGVQQQQGGWAVFSAGDLVAFLECEHATTLALQDLATTLARAADDEPLQLIQEKGFAHEAAFLETLKAKGLGISGIPSEGNAADQAADNILVVAPYNSQNLLRSVLPPGRPRRHHRQVVGQE